MEIFGVVMARGGKYFVLGRACGNIMVFLDKAGIMQKNNARGERALQEGNSTV